MDEETLAKLSPAEKSQVMQQVQQQVAMAQMQELLTVSTYLTPHVRPSQICTISNTLGWSHGCDLSCSLFCRKSPTNASRSVSVPQARRLAQASKSVWRCAWTATWTHSTSFPRATHRGYKENSRT